MTMTRLTNIQKMCVFLFVQRLSHLCVHPQFQVFFTLQNFLIMACHRKKKREYFTFFSKQCSLIEKTRFFNLSSKGFSQYKLAQLSRKHLFIYLISQNRNFYWK
jgi:hypothetical protein